MKMMKVVVLALLSGVLLVAASAQAGSGAFVDYSNGHDGGHVSSGGHDGGHIGSSGGHDGGH